MGNEGCIYCDGGEYFIHRTTETLLELKVNKQTKSLEIHYYDSDQYIDYDGKEVPIKYCPFCGKELSNEKV